MPRRLTFKALAYELVPCAEQVATFLKSMGFQVRAEHHEIAFPYVPSLCCKRKPVVLLVEIVDTTDLKRVSDWVAYCRAVATDTRVALGIPEQAAPSPQAMAKLQELGVGLYVTSETGVREAIPPTDQGMHGAAAALPVLADLPHPVRVILGPAYESIARGNWREAFQDACQAFEDEARRYLKHWSKTTRIKVHRKTRPHTLSNSEIDGFTMGGLAREFRQIISPNQVDITIARTLDDVVGDRNLVIHKKRRARTEARLRRNWKGHVSKIVGALKAIHARNR